MSNDAKLGLVLGVTIVLMIALVFFRTDTLTAKLPAAQTRPTAQKKDPSLQPSMQAHIAPSTP
jgi:hypothetical protein